MKVWKKGFIGFVGAAMLFAAAPVAMAGHDQNPSERVRTYKYSLDQVANNSDASGWTTLSALPNGKIRVKVYVEGLAPGQVHAQHLHGVMGEDGFVAGSCPTIADDSDGDGLIDTLEGAPAYGGVQVSLTTSGDTSASSALAVDRFPVADDSGVVEYSRTFRPNDPAVWEGLGALEIVVHGVDLNGNGVYDFGTAGASSLNPSIPLEVTIPAVCGGPGN